ncbi:hypothetical protein M1146_08255, partial [Patescibacteria group bacterium]|nr:hypothetical protein [Patescibacteria group bacterium]
MKKLFLMFALAILLLGSVSAFDFDNVKRYDAQEKKVTVVNAFGLGDVISNMKLNTPLDNKVGLGYQRVFEIEFVSYQDFKSYLKSENMNLYDIKGKKKIQRTIDYKFKTTENVSVPNYECIKNPDGTNRQCSEIPLSSHTETREVWKDISQLNWKSGEKIVLGGFTDVKNGDKVEWIPSWYGVTVDEWAVWTADLDTGLVAYYTLNETSGSALSMTGKHNGTNTGSPTLNLAGKIGTSYNFSSSSVGFDTPKLYLNSSHSVALWIRSNQSGEHVAVSTASGLYGLNYNYDTQGKIAFYDGAGYVISPSNVYSNGSWFFVVFTVGPSNSTLWIDGINVASAGTTASIPSDNLRIGTGWTSGFIGGIDEVGVWNRTLTNAEITQLYNGGVGMTYTTPSSPNVTLISPTNNTNYTTLSQTLTWTVTDYVAVSNTTLFINGVANYTNTSGVNGPYSVTQNYIDGNYNWSVGAINSLGLVTNSSN